MTTKTWPTTREDIRHHVASVWSLEDYLAFLNRDLTPNDCGLVSDLSYWAEDGITTATQLADYLDGACARNVEKSEMYA